MYYSHGGGGGELVRIVAHHHLDKNRDRDFKMLPDPQFLSRVGTPKVRESQDGLPDFPGLAKITRDWLGSVKELSQLFRTFIPKIKPSKSKYWHFEAFARISRFGDKSS